VLVRVLCAARMEGGACGFEISKAATCAGLSDNSPPKRAAGTTSGPAGSGSRFSRLGRASHPNVRFAPDSGRIAAPQRTAASGHIQTSDKQKPRRVGRGLPFVSATRSRHRFSLPLPSYQPETSPGHDQAGKASASDGAGTGARPATPGGSGAGGSRQASCFRSDSQSGGTC
jgi:hypothetical protein